jgi:hypothetical protein
LWTGIGDDASDMEVFLRFTNRRDLVVMMNQRLTTGTIPQCLLRIPLTQPLYEHLALIPPWADVRRGSPLYRLKRDVLALLRNKGGASGLTLYIDVREVIHLYTWEEPEGFFPPALSPMKEDWVEMVGVCAFDNAIAARDFAHPLPVLGSCVVTSTSENVDARLTRCRIDSDQIEKQYVPLLSQVDIWTWKRWVRSTIWKDERLPFGPIGYRPRRSWHPGYRPRRYRNGYRDALGGLWEWEGGRVVNDRNPFGGHWNVQLPDVSVTRRWVRQIEDRTGREICSRPEAISHINVEPDGRIGDLTFTWCD